MSGTTTFPCPTSGPVLSINAPQFTATGLKIGMCLNSADRGIIVVFPDSNVTFNDLYIHDNQNRAIYIDHNTNVKIVDSRIEMNQAPGNGTGIFVKGSSSISLVNTLIEGE
eukprot:g7734.t1